MISTIRLSAIIIHNGSQLMTHSLNVLMATVLIFNINFTVAAQEGQTLEQCVEYALNNNVGQKKTGLDQKRIDVELKKAKSAFLPSAAITSQYQYYYEFPTQVLPAAILGGPDNQYLPVKLGVTQNLSARLQINQLLFSAPLLFGIKSVQAASELVNVTQAVNEEEIIYTITSLYYNLQILGLKNSLLDSTSLRLTQIFLNSQALVANGLMPVNEVKRLQLVLNNLNNERRNIELARSNLTNTLKFNMGFSFGDSLRIKPFTGTEKRELPLTQLATRLNVKAIEKSIAVARLEKTAIHSQNAPTVSAFLNAGYTAFNDRFSISEKINNTWYPGTVLGLQMSVPIFDRTTRFYAAKLKTLEIQEKELAMDLMTMQNELQYRNAINDYGTRKNISVNSLENLQFAQSVLRSAEIELHAGLISMTDLLKILDELTTARNVYTESVIKLLIAELEVRRASGQLLRP